ncbi:uncharacterized protein LOC143258945 [Megalopta genalis]|uniref:uncharacterized protein LOC143258945 n=1 Tax=Megalopta genalis TaxID=115081 RepID=UPI003FD3BD96
MICFRFLILSTLLFADDIWHETPGIHGLSEGDFNYVVRDPISNIPCSLASMTISVNLRYKITNNSEKQTTFAMPKNANVSGNCDLRNPMMTLLWVPKHAVIDMESPNGMQNSISLIFSEDDLKFHVSMISVDFYLDEKNFPDVSDSMQRRYKVDINNLNLFDADIMDVYKCDSETVVEFHEVQLTFSDVAITAFNTFWNGTFLDENWTIPPIPSSERGIPFWFNFLIGAVAGMTGVTVAASIKIMIAKRRGKQGPGYEIPT